VSPFIKEQLQSQIQGLMLSFHQIPSFYRPSRNYAILPRARPALDAMS